MWLYFRGGKTPIFISKKLKKNLEMIQKLDSVLDSCVCKASPKDQIFEFFHPQKKIGNSSNLRSTFPKPNIYSSF